MAIEGLQALLQKEPVVGTPSVDQLRDDPEGIDARLRRHVRTYVPFEQAGATEDDSIQAYERRLVAAVRGGRAPKGYITADFGYGKTSTALYLWQRCREARILTVPPFQLERLDQLITATWAWTRYELNRQAPAFVSRADDIYRRFSDMSLERRADGDAQVLRVLERELAEGRLSLDLVPADYIRFLEDMTALVLEAGFEGLLLLPDELQQYVESAVRHGRGDPIGPLFNIVQGLLTRRGQLRAGIIFITPAKELGVINDQRGDLIQRLRDDRLALDLRTIYDKQFASRLWQRMAREFDFEAEAGAIALPEALASLGQIAARDDLANGPRTVVAGFSFMTRRFLQRSESFQPLTPTDLVDAFLTGEIPFVEASFQKTVNQHLSAPLISERPEFGSAVKLLAAFPTDGATESVIQRLGMTEAVGELDRLAHGDIVITVGGGRDSEGNAVPYGLTLFGLEPASAVATDWLSRTLRDYSHSFIENAHNTIERTIQAFRRLLLTQVFREADGWKVIEQTDALLTESAGFVVEGSFPAMRKQFPDRRVQVRIVGDDEQPRGTRSAHVTIDIALRRHFDLAIDARRDEPGTMTIDAPAGYARFDLNLFYRASEQFYPDLQTTLGPVISPHSVSSLLMLSLDAFLDEQRAARLIPAELDREVALGFQRSLLDHSLAELFNRSLGSRFGVSGERIIEQLVRTICEARYPDYRTIMPVQSWQSWLRDYETALAQLANRDERQGDVPVSGTKSEIAAKFSRTNVALDAFINGFPDLFTVTAPFEGRGSSASTGSVTFTLHPLERRVLDLLREGREETVRVSGQQLVIHVIDTTRVYALAEELGYLQRETDTLLSIMAKRELVEIDPRRGEVRETAHPALRADDLRRELQSLATTLQALASIAPQDTWLTTTATNVRNMQRRLADAAQHPDAVLQGIARNVRIHERDARGFEQRQREQLADDLRRIDAKSVDAERLQRFAAPITGGLFAPQLESIRQQLHAVGGEIAAESERLRFDLQQAISQAGDPAIPLDRFRDLRKRADDFRHRARTIVSRSDDLENQLVNFDWARRSLSTALEIEQALLARRSNEVELLREQFAALIRDVRADLSADKHQALNRAMTWDQQLTAFRLRLTEVGEVERRQFDQTIDRYVELLRQALRLPAGQQPFQTIFNPADPETSLRLLHDEAAAMVRQFIAGLLTRLVEWRDALEQLLASGDLAIVQDASNLERECRQLVHGIDAITRDVSAFIERIRPACTIDDIRPNGAFAAYMNECATLATTANDLGSHYQTFEGHLRPLLPTDDERALRERIEQLGSFRPGPLEVGALLASLPPAAQSSAWATLQQLHRKRLIRVHVSLVDDGT